MRIRIHALAFFLSAGLMLVQSSTAMAEELPSITEDEILQEDVVNSIDHMDNDIDIRIESVEEDAQNDEEISSDPLNLEDYNQDDTVISDTVFNEDELAQWISEHKYIGGTVTLGAMVTITDYLQLYVNEAAPITIDTGKFGLVYDGACIYEDLGYWQVVGEGVDVPVVDAIAAPQYIAYLSSWNHDLMQMNITATGRDGLGGTALRVRAVDENTLDTTNLRSQGTIRSYGEGAVGLWLDVPMAAYGYRIEVYGDNSTAVYAPNGAELYYCKLIADGNGANTVTGSDVLVDTCATSPAPHDMQVIYRHIDTESLNQFYISLKQNAEPDFELLYMLNTPGFFLSSSNGGDGETRYFCVEWDLDAFSSVDTSILGKTQITATVDDVFMGLGLFDDINITMTVEVRNPDLPCIGEVNIRKKYDDNKMHVYLIFWESYDMQDENVILWRSDDEGETWWNAKNSPDIEWYGDRVDYSYEELLNPVWFQLEIVGVGESNISTLSEKNGVTYGGWSGDRTGTDREGAGTDTGDETNATDSGDVTNATGNSDDTKIAENTNPNTGENEESLYDGNGNGGDTQTQHIIDNGTFLSESKDRQYAVDEHGRNDVSSDNVYVADTEDVKLPDEENMSKQIETEIIERIESNEAEASPDIEEQLIEITILPELNVPLSGYSDDTLQLESQLTEKEAPYQSEETVTDNYDSQQSEAIVDNDVQLQSEQTLSDDEQSDIPLTDKAQSSTYDTTPTFDTNQIAPAPVNTDAAMIALLCAAVVLAVPLLVLRLRISRR